MVLLSVVPEDAWLLMLPVSSGHVAYPMVDGYPLATESQRKIMVIYGDLR